MKILKSLMTMFPVIMLLSACAGAGDEAVPSQIPIRVLFSSAHCAASAAKPSLSVLSSQRQWDESMMQLSKISGHTDDTIRVSFTNEVVVQVNMGQKPTGGYSLKLAQEEAALDDGWVNIQLQWKQPAQGMMLTQALTSPCVMLALPRHDYQGIRVLDQTGKLRLETALQ